MNFGKISLESVRTNFSFDPSIPPPPPVLKIHAQFVKATRAIMQRLRGEFVGVKALIDVRALSRNEVAFLGLL